MGYLVAVVAVAVDLVVAVVAEVALAEEDPHPKAATLAALLLPARRLEIARFDAPACLLIP